MKAIFTKYHGPTNTRGARISALDSDGNRVSISYPYELSGEACHKAACDALLAKMGWTGEMVSGETRNGYVFVLTSQRHVPIIEHITEAKCFSCDAVLSSESDQMVETEGGQPVVVGRECFKKVVQAGKGGYQPPLGGSKLYLLGVRR